MNSSSANRNNLAAQIREPGIDLLDEINSERRKAQVLALASTIWTNELGERTNVAEDKGLLLVKYLRRHFLLVKISLEIYFHS